MVWNINGSHLHTSLSGDSLLNRYRNIENVENEKKNDLNWLTFYPDTWVKKSAKLILKWTIFYSQNVLTNKVIQWQNEFKMKEEGNIWIRETVQMFVCERIFFKAFLWWLANWEFEGPEGEQNSTIDSNELLPVWIFN